MSAADPRSFAARSPAPGTVDWRHPGPDHGRCPACPAWCATQVLCRRTGGTAWPRGRAGLVLACVLAIGATTAAAARGPDTAASDDS